MAFPSFLTEACPSSSPYCNQVSIPYFLLPLFLIFLLSFLLYSSTIIRTFKAMVSRSGAGQPTAEPVSADTKAFTKPEGPSQEFSGKIKVSQKSPSRKDLEKVADLPLLDRNGEARSFKSLHSDPEHRDVETLIIFIRHFFCGVCSRHLQCRVASITNITA